MSAKNRTKKCLFCQVVYLRVVRVRLLLDEGALVSLMLRYVVSRVSKNGPIVSLGLAVSLWMVPSGC